MKAIFRLIVSAATVIAAVIAANAAAMPGFNDCMTLYSNWAQSNSAPAGASRAILKSITILAEVRELSKDASAGSMPALEREIVQMQANEYLQLAHFSLLEPLGLPTNYTRSGMFVYALSDYLQSCAGSIQQLNRSEYIFNELTADESRHRARAIEPVIEKLLVNTARIRFYYDHYCSRGEYTNADYLIEKIEISLGNLNQMNADIIEGADVSAEAARYCDEYIFWIRLLKQLSENYQSPLAPMDIPRTGVLLDTPEHAQRAVVIINDIILRLRRFNRHI